MKNNCMRKIKRIINNKYKNKVKYIKRIYTHK
jgi:hypothetical protein